jgi:peroxiredoxin
MKNHKVDLDAATGNDNHILPHPAVFVVDTKGVIRFVHVNPDFKVRLEPSKVLEAAKTAKQ